MVCAGRRGRRGTCPAHHRGERGEGGSAHRSRTPGGQSRERGMRENRDGRPPRHRDLEQVRLSPRVSWPCPPEWTVSRLNAQGQRLVLWRESDVQEQLLILGDLSWVSGPLETWAAAGGGGPSLGAGNSLSGRRIFRKYNWAAWGPKRRPPTSASLCSPRREHQ